MIGNPDGDVHTPNAPNLPELIVDYVTRMPATIGNVASHFGMTPKAAHDALIDLECAGFIEPAGRYCWRVRP